jgi:hypothetical protein
MQELRAKQQHKNKLQQALLRFPLLFRRKKSSLGGRRFDGGCDAERTRPKCQPSPATAFRSC